MADLQEAQVTFHMRMRERELSLRERAREMAYELDRLSLGHKAAIKQAEKSTSMSVPTRHGRTSPAEVRRSPCG